MANKIDLAGRFAVITGGAQGIGRAIAERFLDSGAGVAIWDRDLALAEKTMGEIKSRGKVAAAGVNRPDVMQRLGRYPPPPGVTDIPGLEIAGTVARCGAAVRRWKPDDAVAALVPGGGYAPS